MCVKKRTSCFFTCLLIIYRENHLNASQNKIWIFVRNTLTTLKTIKMFFIGLYLRKDKLFTKLFWKVTKKISLILLQASHRTNSLKSSNLLKHGTP